MNNFGIIETISRTDFHEAFSRASQYHLQNRLFSYEALNALYDHLVEMCEKEGTNYKLDVIALCHEFVEYKSGIELHKDYPQYFTLDEIKDNTLLLELHNGGYLIKVF